MSMSADHPDLERQGGLFRQTSQPGRQTDTHRRHRTFAAMGGREGWFLARPGRPVFSRAVTQQGPAGLLSIVMCVRYVAGSICLFVCVHLLMVCVVWQHTMHRRIDRSDRSHAPSLPPCLSVSLALFSLALSVCLSVCLSVREVSHCRHQWLIVCVVCIGIALPSVCVHVSARVDRPQLACLPIRSLVRWFVSFNQRNSTLT